ncbi:MAG TPA: DUF4834 family protein [Flavobacterium sp.]|nr:DUF4834 family protein [Flavobacterium sp.]
MDQASFTGFLKTVLIIVLIYYFIKFAFRLLAPYLVKKAMNKVSENFQKQQEAYYNQTQNQHQNSQATNNQGFEENIKQNKIPKERKKVGEYIDFEEIE